MMVNVRSFRIKVAQSDGRPAVPEQERLSVSALGLFHFYCSRMMPRLVLDIKNRERIRGLQSRRPCHDDALSLDWEPALPDEPIIGEIAGFSLWGFGAVGGAFSTITLPTALSSLLRCRSKLALLHAYRASCFDQ
jgi:hypothetical protein